MADFDDIYGNLVQNRHSFTIYFNKGITIKENDKLFCYKKKQPDKYGRPIFFITTTEKDWTKKEELIEQEQPKHSEEEVPF